jgi:diadenosine tetraphosphate (Ap4A) HIT family hydrolase
MPESPQEFYERVATAADTNRRLPPPDMTGWTEIFPYELDSLRIVPLLEPQPEPLRAGTDGIECSDCRRGRPTVWSDDVWSLSLMTQASGVLVLMLRPFDHVDLTGMSDQLAADLGRLSAHIARAIESLPHIARAHVMRIGDGGEHLHIWFFARPAEQLQMRGSALVLWDDILPPLPEVVRQADGRAIAAALAASYGGTVS